MFKWLKSIFESLDNWFHKGVNDEYIIVNASPVTEEKDEEVPESLKASDIPDFGIDQYKMLKLAVKNFPDNSARIKWLNAMHKLRFGTSVGWIADTNPQCGDNRYLKGKKHLVIRKIQNQGKSLATDLLPSMVYMRSPGEPGIISFDDFDYLPANHSKMSPEAMMNLLKDVQMYPPLPVKSFGPNGSTFTKTGKKPTLTRVK
jgi:hypothetical protein